jgi:hypothetical protein
LSTVTVVLHVGIPMVMGMSELSSDAQMGATLSGIRTALLHRA